MPSKLLYFFAFLLACSCSPPDESEQFNKKRIVSLDFCADQYVLKLADRQSIAALSPDATASFSYMREQAKGIPSVRPTAEDVLLLKPDIVVRTYGGGPDITEFFKRVGTDVVQIGYAPDLQSIETVVTDAADAMDARKRGQEIISQMQRRLSGIEKNNSKIQALYLTSRGAVAGKNTLINDIFEAAGITNFEQRGGWHTLPLESLAANHPDLVVTGFFESSDLTTDIWTPSRHTVVKRLLKSTPTVNFPGAWTACGGWFMVDAIEKLAAVKVVGSAMP